MTPVYIDFETYWSTTHTLSRMSPTEYVMHPDTEIISCAIKVADGPTEVIFGEDEIKRTLNEMDWSDSMAIGHNMSGFDSMIMAWRLGIRPKMWGCTAAMARPAHSKTEVLVDGRRTVGVSLKKLAVEFGVGKKLDLEATNTKGKHLKDFFPDELELMKEYNKVDTELCAELFKKLAKGFPKQELLHIHMCTEMLVNPQFEVDAELLETTLKQVQDDKEKSLADLAVLLDVEGIEGFEGAIENRMLNGVPLSEHVRAKLASSARFADLLQQRGVEVPMKPSPANPSKMTPALAKTDEAFIRLQEHDDPVVAAAARARLEVKSTLLETRIQAFLDAAAACGGRLPVPLKYCGADTTGRWSGEQYNMQNLPRIPRDKAGNIVHKLSNALRLAVRAPKGHKIVVSDLSGIELRVNHFLWKVPGSMALYQQDAEADLYRAFAAARYNILADQVTKDQRQLAKVAQLGLGFGAGAATFQKVAKLMGGLALNEEEANAVVSDWRTTYSEIVQGWKDFQAALPDIQQGVAGPIDPWGMCQIEKDKVRLPSGRAIHYPNLVRERDDKGKTEWWYGSGRTRARIYAGKGVENLVQALARDVIADNAVAIRKVTGFSPALMVHDELVYVVPDSEADGVLDTVQSIMRTPPSWWPELITWSEGDIADCYGEAK